MDFNDPTPLPTLSTDGWVSHSKKKLDYLLTHFWLSEYSSSEIYAGHVASLPWLLQTHKNSMANLASATERTLQFYLGRYFPMAKVQVQVTEVGKGSNKYDMHMGIEITDHAGSIVMGGINSRFMNTKLETIALLNNEGTYEQKPIA